MFDASISLLSIDASVPDRTEKVSKALLIRTCKFYVFSSERIYSELEEMTFDVLNTNTGYGALDVEFIFVNDIVQKSYPQFYTKCFVIRTDTGAIVKPMKTRNYPAYSKINQNGELVIGIRYYFKDKREIAQIMQCKSILIEGFIALGKPTNVFGIMCQLVNEENGWKISSAYTYKPTYAKNIKNLID